MQVMYVQAVCIVCGVRYKGRQHVWQVHVRSDLHDNRCKCTEHTECVWPVATGSGTGASGGCQHVEMLRESGWKATRDPGMLRADKYSPTAR